MTSFLHTGWNLVRGLPAAGALNDHRLLPPDPCPSQDPGREGLVTLLGKHARAQSWSPPTAICIMKPPGGSKICPAKFHLILNENKQDSEDLSLTFLSPLSPSSIKVVLYTPEPSEKGVAQQSAFYSSGQSFLAS